NRHAPVIVSSRRKRRFVVGFVCSSPNVIPWDDPGERLLPLISERTAAIVGCLQACKWLRIIGGPTGHLIISNDACAAGHACCGHQKSYAAGIGIAVIFQYKLMRSCRKEDVR